MGLRAFGICATPAEEALHRSEDAADLVEQV
jgi:hypothetical protein